MNDPTTHTGAHRIVAARLVREQWPRLQLSLILGGAALTGFVASVALRHAGLRHPAWRYALCALLAYGAFLALLRLWVAWQRRGRPMPDLDLTVDELPTGSGSGGGGGGFGFGGGGGFSGGGAGGRLPLAAPDDGGGSGLLADAGKHVADGARDLVGAALDDEGAPIVLVVVAIVVAIASVALIGVVVWNAPALLAEVLLDSAVAGVAYRQIAKREQQHWTFDVLRRTWKPMGGIVVLVTLLGVVARAVEPRAATLGEAWRGLPPAALGQPVDSIPTTGGYIGEPDSTPPASTEAAAEPAGGR